MSASNRERLYSRREFITPTAVAIILTLAGEAGIFIVW